MPKKKGNTSARPDSPVASITEEILVEDIKPTPPSDSEHPPDNHAEGDEPETPAGDPDLDDPQSRAFAKVLAQAMGQAMGQLVQQVRQSSAPDPTKYPKAKDPSMFNGRNRKGLRTWIGENEICFRTAPNLYKTETSKVMFAGSFLDGDAKSWFTDYFKDPARIPAFMDDWNLFTIELQRNFGLEDEIGAAEEELRKLSMNDRDHATYFTAHFRAIVSNLQDTWNDRTLRNQYYLKIAPRLRIQFVSSGTPVPATLEPLISTTERFDRAYWANLELDRAMNAQNSASRDKTKNEPGTHKNEPKVTPKTEPTTPKNTTPRPKQDGHLDSQGKLTDTKRQHRMGLGACLYCGEVGHFAKECPKKTGTQSKPAASAPGTASSVKQLARATITVEPETDADLGKE